jgi:hypothetical protein
MQSPLQIRFACVEIASCLAMTQWDKKKPLSGFRKGA